MQRTAASCAESMYKARKRKGTLKDPDAPVKFVAFGGDGSTYDIGLAVAKVELWREDMTFTIYLV